ncbi:MAG: hypothetical protein HY918_02785, partial [Candidatus Doudnabacteria bacterium]|nr:hypothetical protein [Candidatus Doudnabacteria bacterium]
DAEAKKVLGAFALPTNLLADFECEFIKFRIKNKCYAEFKWSKVTPTYVNKYKEFLDLFFSNSKATFHAICYRTRSQKFKAAYLLLRALARKIILAKPSSSLIIIFDENQKLGVVETKKIKEFAKKDLYFKLPIDYCNQTSSHTLGVLQIADILSGALATKINGGDISKPHKELLSYIESHNTVPIDWSNPSFPSLYDYKMHFFDPANNPKIPKI